MGEEYITRAEHNAFKEALNAENERQNHRLTKLEDTSEKINELAVSTQKLATSMEQMLEEQREQGKRICKLEGRDGEKWRQIAGYILTAIIGAGLGFLLNAIGLVGG